MRILKKILLVIVVLIALVLIVALFVKKDHSVEREITINQPKEKVFDYVRYLKNQEQYNIWVMQDPNMKKEIKGTDGTVGAIYAWDSEKKEAGKGEEEIANIVEGERVDFALRFVKPMKGKASTSITTEAIDSSSTKVRNSFSSTTPYPMNIMCLFMNMEDMLGKAMDQNLGNLKGILEKQ